MEYVIIQNTAEERFEALADHLIIGVINYYKQDKVITVTHTGVQADYEGKGIAAALTKSLLSYIAKNDLKVAPLCPYTKAYIDRHPEYKSLVKEDEYD